MTELDKEVREILITVTALKVLTEEIRAQVLSGRHDIDVNEKDIQAIKMDLASQKQNLQTLSQIMYAIFAFIAMQAVGVAFWYLKLDLK